MAVSNRLQLIITAGQRALKLAGVGHRCRSRHKRLLYIGGGDEESVNDKLSEKEAGTQIQSGEQAERRPKAVDRGPVLGELSPKERWTLVKSVSFRKKTRSTRVSPHALTIFSRSSSGGVNDSPRMISWMQYIYLDGIDMVVVEKQHLESGWKAGLRSHNHV